MNTVLYKDPRINIDNVSEMNVVVSQGAQRITQYITPADGVSTQQSNFNFQPPSTKIILDRFFQIRARVKLVAVGGTFDLGVATALRQVPLASLMKNLNIELNGGSINDNVSRRIHEILKFNNDERARNRYLNKTASMPDQFINYGDWQLYGSNRNPLADYGEVGVEQSRGGFPFVSAVETAPGSKKYTEIVYDLTEPLFLSPLSTGLEEYPDPGFVNVNNVSVNIQYITNLNYILSHVNLGLNTLSGVTVTFERPPELIINYLTPDANYPLPLVQVMSYHKWIDSNTNIGFIPGNNTFRAISNTLKLNQIPRSLLLYVKRNEASQTFLTSDAYARIDSINILWNNENALLSSYSRQGLFDICKRNGSNQLWSQYEKYQGSVFRLEFGTDIGLASGLSPSTMGQFTIQVELNCTNLDSAAVNYDFNMALLLEGSLELSENSLAQNLGLLTVQDVVNAEMKGDEVHHTNAEVGQGFYSSLKNFISKASRGINKASKFAEKYVVPAVSAIAPEIAGPLSQGVQFAKKVTGGRVSGGGRSGGRVSGGRASGGRVSGGGGGTYRRMIRR